MAAQVCGICNNAAVMNESRRERYAKCLSDNQEHREGR